MPKEETITYLSHQEARYKHTKCHLAQYYWCLSRKLSRPLHPYDKRCHSNIISNGIYPPSKYNHMMSHTNMKAFKVNNSNNITKKTLDGMSNIDQYNLQE